MKYPKHLWSVESASTSLVPLPPFLDLLHRAELGYPLYGPTGIPLSATIIPALLPDRPIGYSSSGLLGYFRLDGGDTVRHPDVVLSFTKPQLQRAFVAQLIVRLGRFTMVDGVWKHGGVLKGDDDSGNKSTCIFYVESNQLTVLSMGSREESTGARSNFFNELFKLVTEKYSTLRACSIQFGSTFLDSLDVEAVLFRSEGIIRHEGSKLSLWRLSSLFGVSRKKKYSSSVEVSNPLRLIEGIKPNSDGVLGGDDRINLVYRLKNSIPYFVSLQGLGDRSVHTLWVVYRSTETNSCYAYAIAPGAKPSLAWELVKESAIPLPQEKFLDDCDSEFMEASEILKTVLFHLIEVDVKKYEYVGLQNMREIQDDIKSKEMELFRPIDDLPAAHYVLKSSMISASVKNHIQELKCNVNKGFSEIGRTLERFDHQQKQVVCCHIFYSHNVFLYVLDVFYLLLF